MGLRDWLGRVFGTSEADTPTWEQPGATTPVPSVPTEADLLAALDRTEAMVSGGVVPALVVSRVKRITDIVRQTLPRLRNLGLGSPEAYSVMATATDYLPEAVGAYLRLPRQWADTRPIENGKTSLMLLTDQLDLLGGTMDKILDAAVRMDAQALIVHGRFLQAKFGPAASGGALGLDSSVPPPPPNTLDLP
ncbi:MAG TPA: hypothetical protein VFP34_12165 [Microlunatus sp.]|nr:hypothetical protein [Microlunatus sp.]